MCTGCKRLRTTCIDGPQDVLAAVCKRALIAAIVVLVLADGRRIVMQREERWCKLLQQHLQHALAEVLVIQLQPVSSTFQLSNLLLSTA